MKRKCINSMNINIGIDKEKQSELKEYLKVQYKGDLPDHLKGRNIEVVIIILVAVWYL